MCYRQFANSCFKTFSVVRIMDCVVFSIRVYETVEAAVCFPFSIFSSVLQISSWLILEMEKYYINNNNLTHLSYVFLIKLGRACTMVSHNQWSRYLIDPKTNHPLFFKGRRGPLLMLWQEKFHIKAFSYEPIFFKLRRRQRAVHANVYGEILIRFDDLQTKDILTEQFISLGYLVIDSSSGYLFGLKNSKIWDV